MYIGSTEGSQRSQGTASCTGLEAGPIFLSRHSQEEMAQSWEKLAELRKRDRESEREARCEAGETRDAHPH